MWLTCRVGEPGFPPLEIKQTQEEAASSSDLKHGIIEGIKPSPGTIVAPWMLCILWGTEQLLVWSLSPPLHVAPCW